MKYEKWGSIDSRTVRIGPHKCKLCHFEPTCICLGLTPVLPISNYIKCVYWANPVYIILGLKPMLLTHLNCVRNLYSSINIKAFSNFILNHLLVVYLTLIYFTTYWIVLLIQSSSCIRLLKLCTLPISIKVTMIWMSIIYLLHLLTPTFMKQHQGLVYRSLICIKFYQVTIYFQFRLFSI